MKPRAWTLSSLLLAACQASVGGEVNSAGEGEVQAKLEGAEGFEPEPVAVPTELREGLPEGAALLGARHDLFLREGASAHECSCLAVAAGRPHDPVFAWESLVPEIDPATQLVVAFTSRGQVCEDEPSGSQGAAYHGHEKRGADVVVMLEASLPGRPLVTGAILPRPDPGGRLIVQPISADLPYAKAGRGSARCEVPLGP